MNDLKVGDKVKFTKEALANNFGIEKERGTVTAISRRGKVQSLIEVRWTFKDGIDRINRYYLEKI